MMTEYFLSINDVGTRLDIPAHTLRYWEKQFPTTIKPTTGAGGRRYYRPETVAALETIKDLLYNRGMTIAGVKKLIRAGEFGNNDNFAPKSITNHESRITNHESRITNRPGIDSAINLLEQARAILA